MTTTLIEKWIEERKANPEWLTPNEHFRDGVKQAVFHILTEAEKRSRRERNGRPFIFFDHLREILTSIRGV